MTSISFLHNVEKFPKQWLSVNNRMITSILTQIINQETVWEIPGCILAIYGVPLNGKEHFSLRKRYTRSLTP